MPISLKSDDMKKYILFLIAVASLCCLFAGCGSPEIDYVVKADWVYINDTEHTIEVKGFYNFTLEPQGSYTIYQDGDGPEQTTEESYIAPFVFGISTIVIDGETEIPIGDSGITDRKNYTSEKIADRHYKFTYTFTDADFPEE